MIWPFNRIVKRVLHPVFEFRRMRFPTFSQQVQAGIVDHCDYSRYATIGLAIERIKKERIEGAFAEAGVFQGEMSAFIHGLVPDRRYYLFDTFEGFPQDDLEEGQVDTRFQNTNVDAVLDRVGRCEQVIARVGRVPETFEGLEGEPFAFVLLDMDLYGPTLASLSFFYERLSVGGYLFVHDYNSPESGRGCERAVNEFMGDKPEKVVELADLYGSIVFRKQ